MKARCYNSNHPSFHYYGGRGIYVCDEWKDNFSEFYEWSTKNGWRDGLTIDRKENDLGYNPNNCRYVTMLVQNRNNSVAEPMLAFGETKWLREWAADHRCKVPFKTLENRIYKGWELEDAILTPKLFNYIKAFDSVKTLNEWMNDSRCVVKNYSTIYHRIFKYNWKPEIALTKSK